MQQVVRRQFRSPRFADAAHGLCPVRAAGRTLSSIECSIPRKPSYFHLPRRAGSACRRPSHTALSSFLASAAKQRCQQENPTVPRCRAGPTCPATGRLAPYKLAARYVVHRARLHDFEQRCMESTSTRAATTCEDSEFRRHDGATAARPPAGEADIAFAQVFRQRYRALQFPPARACAARTWATQAVSSRA